MGYYADIANLVPSDDGYDDELTEWRQEIGLLDRGAAQAPVARVRMVEMDIYDPEVARDIARRMQE